MTEAQTIKRIVMAIARVRWGISLNNLRHVELIAALALDAVRKADAEEQEQQVA